MKLKSLVALCTLGVAGQALALPPTTTPDIQVFQSGSSAQQASLGGIFSRLCKAGTLNTYADTATGGSNHRAYFCQISGGQGTISLKNVLYINRGQGGSFQGVGPVARAQSITRMVVDNTCVAQPSGSTFDYLCPNTTSSVPDMGVADVEPEMFRLLNLPTGETALSTQERSQIAVFPEYAVIMGTAASDNLYQALQTAQGLQAGNFNDANRPSLTASQIRSIIRKDDAGGGVNPYHVDWTKLGISNPAGGGTVNVCRRAPGSGTQAAANMYFLRAPCEQTPPQFLPAAAADSTATFVVNEASSSGAVRTCLNNAFNGNQYAIGHITTEVVPGGSDKWHHIKIDGIDPTLANAVNGRYEYFVEQTLMRRNQTVNSVPPMSGDALTFFNTFRTYSGTANVLAPLPGTAALPTISPYPGANNNVLKGTRTPTPKVPSSCRMPVLVN